MTEMHFRASELAVRSADAAQVKENLCLSLFKGEYWKFRNQRYMSTASVTYQREIMRLRGALHQADPAALRALGPPPALAGTG
eukprot:gene6874-7090_t